MRKPPFRGTAGFDDAHTLPDPFVFYRERRLAPRAARPPQAGAVFARVMTAIEADVAERQRTGTQLDVSPVTSVRGNRLDTAREVHRPVMHTARTWLMRAASVLIVYTGGMWAIQLSYSELRAQEV